MRAILLATVATSFVAAPLLADPQASVPGSHTSLLQLAQYQDNRDQAERDRQAREQYQRDHAGDQGDRRDGQPGYGQQGDRHDGDQRGRDGQQNYGQQGDRHDGERHDGDRHDGDRHDGDRHGGDQRGRDGQNGYSQYGDRHDGNGYRRDGEYAAGSYYPEKDYRAGRKYRTRYLGQNEQVYRGRDDRYYCKRPDGTTGLIIGGLGGGVLGNVIAPGGSKTLGTVLGGGLGAVLGNVIGKGSNQTRVQCR